MARIDVDFCINYCEANGTAYISSNERKWINKVLSLEKKHSDEVKVLKLPEDNGGFIYAKIPQKWISLRPPRNSNMSDERRAEIAERFRKARGSGQSGNQPIDDMGDEQSQ